MDVLMIGRRKVLEEQIGSLFPVEVCDAQADPSARVPAPVEVNLDSGV